MSFLWELGGKEKERFLHNKNFLTAAANRAASSCGVGSLRRYVECPCAILRLNLITQVVVVILAMCRELSEDTWSGFPTGAFFPLAAMAAVVKENFCE